MVTYSFAEDYAAICKKADVKKISDLRKKDKAIEVYGAVNADSKRLRNIDVEFVDDDDSKIKLQIKFHWCFLQRYASAAASLLQISSDIPFLFFLFMNEIYF